MKRYKKPLLYGARLDLKYTFGQEKFLEEAARIRNITKNQMIRNLIDAARGKHKESL